MSAQISPREADENHTENTSHLPEVQIDPNELAEHLASVQFIKPNVKIICSKHKGSILAEEGPLVKLNDEELEKVRNVFQKALAEAQAHADALRNDAQQGKGKGKDKDIAPDPIIDEGPKTHLPRESLPTLMEAFGFLYTHHEHFESLTNRLYDVPSEFDEDTFCNFVQHYRAPAFYYGQRMRRYVARGEVEDALELIIRGCEPNTADGEGLTALHYASEFNRFEFIEKVHALSGERLMLNPKDKYGWTPLHCACHHGNEKCVRVLLDLGADHSSVDVVGKTPLHFAAAQDREVICLALLDAGANAASKDKHFMTPVHDAAYKGHTKIYRLLSKVPSADRQAKDKLGYTAADYVSILAAEGEMPPLPPDDETLYSSLQSGSVPGKGKKLTHSTASVGSKKSIPGKKK